MGFSVKSGAPTSIHEHNPQQFHNWNRTESGAPLLPQVIIHSPLIGNMVPEMLIYDNMTNPNEGHETCIG